MFRVNMLSATFAILITVIAVLIAPYSQDIATYSGVIISYGFSIANILNQFVICMVAFEGNMAAVDRMSEYQNLPPEGIFEGQKPSQQWPSENSKIEVKNL